jgi:hypothetical protein
VRFEPTARGRPDRQDPERDTLDCGDRITIGNPDAQPRRPRLDLALYADEHGHRHPTDQISSTFQLDSYDWRSKVSWLPEDPSRRVLSEGVESDS